MLYACINLSPKCKSNCQEFEIWRSLWNTSPLPGSFAGFHMNLGHDNRSSTSIVSYISPHSAQTNEIFIQMPLEWVKIQKNYYN